MIYKRYVDDLFDMIDDHLLNNALFFSIEFIVSEIRFLNFFLLHLLYEKILLKKRISLDFSRVI